MNKSIFLILMINLLISMMFFLASKKEKWEKMKSSTFECGFNSYYHSRFSFSIHYLIVALIFLFFDLELCFLMPFMNENSSSYMMKNSLTFFILILLMGLLIEWKTKKLEWTE